MVEVSISGAVRSMIFRHKFQQNTDRIARITVNVAICRTFLRSVAVIVPPADERVTDSRLKYRPQTDRMGIGGLAGLSSQ
jgi:hypothetical protein